MKWTLGRNAIQNFTHCSPDSLVLTWQ